MHFKLGMQLRYELHSYMPNTDMYVTYIQFTFVRTSHCAVAIFKAFMWSLKGLIKSESPSLLEFVLQTYNKL